MATNITLQPGESVTITAAGGIGQPEPPITPPPTTEPPPVTTPPPEGNRPPAGVYVSDQGELTWDGVRHDTQGMVGPDMIGSFRIVIPNSPAGTRPMISVFEIYDGNPWKHAVLSRTQGDMSGAHPYAAGSTGPNLYMGFGVPDTVPVAAGEVWYLNVRMELWSIINVSAPNLPVDPSVAQGQSCNFGVKLYPAS